jgi:aminopeptidase N
LKRILYILVFFPLLLNAQYHSSCPLSHQKVDVYENPLYDKYLSKYDVKFYHLSLDVSNENTYLEGFTSILIEIVEDVDTIVFQLANTMEITSIYTQDNELDYFRAEDAVYILFNASAEEELYITIHYKGDAGQDRGFFAGISTAWDATNNQQVTYTLSEPLNAKDWFPVKQVLTDKADSVWFDITCDNSLMAGSNGLLIETEDIGGGKHTFKWRSHYPIAYYLISFAVADYRDYSFNAPLAEEGDSVLVQNFIYDDDGYFNNWKSRIDETGDLISLYSRLVIDYPFKDEKYGHCVAPMGGGMEHQTMTTLANFNFTLVAHELAHMWFGDNITCASWQDIWINEGFASYFEYLALQNLRSQEDADQWMC